MRRVSVLLMCAILASCTSISHRIQSSVNTPVNRYPPANPINPALEKPPIVDLRQYRSVHTRLRQNNNIAVALAASGGGYRAANLTLGVLLGLEKMHGNLLRQVDYFSTVSGGGFGVGYYITQLYNHRYDSGFSLNRTVQNMLSHEDVAENPLRADLTEYLFFGKQRGLALEKKLNDTILATPEGGLTLGDIFVPKKSRSSLNMPYWVTNATIYQNADVFPFSPDVLTRYGVIGYFHNNNLQTLQNSYDMPVAVGLTASASVPVALPTTTLISRGCDKECYLQLYDGGLSDNLGVYTALSFLLQDKSKIKVLIVVDAYKGNVQPFSELKEPPGSIPLVERIFTISTDSNHEHIKPNIHFVARDVLCGNGASHVIVIYLDLSHTPEAQKVGTELTLSLTQQKLLLQVGQNLVMHDPVIKTFLRQLAENKIRLGRCSR